MRKGAIAPWSNSSSPYYIQTLTALGKHYKFTLDTKWKDLPKATQKAILYGSGDDEEIRFTYDDGVRSYTTKKPFEGVITNLERRYKETESDWAREEIGRYFTDIPCDACKGCAAQARGAVREGRRASTSARPPTCRSKARWSGSPSCRSG